MFDWMSSGPPPLDLLTPLAEGEKQGMQQAYRQDQIKVEAAKEADMKARLGLEQKAQDFQQNMWNSQADARSAQLTLVQNQGKESAMALNHVADDDATMLDAKSALADSYKTGIAPPAFTFNTPGAQQAWEQSVNQFHQSKVGMAAAQDVNMDLAVKAAAIKAQTEQKSAVLNIPNADPSIFYDTDPKTGVKIWNSGRAAAALNDFAVASDTAKQARSAKAMGDQLKFQASEYSADQRAKTSAANNTNTNYTRQRDSLVAARAHATALGQDTSYYDKALADLQATQGGDNNVTPTTPSIPAINPSTPWLQNLQSGK